MPGFGRLARAGFGQEDGSIARQQIFPVQTHAIPKLLFIELVTAPAFDGQFPKGSPQFDVVIRHSIDPGLVRAGPVFYRPRGGSACISDWRACLSRL